MSSSVSNQLKKQISKYCPKQLKRGLRWFVDCFTWDPYFVRSWSQEGEDLVLRRIFDGKLNGFYVDVGAHHPKRFSNTYYFYRKGWMGVNIDPMPGSMAAFEKFRPRDFNIEVGCGLANRQLEYFQFNDPALNTFSSDLANQRVVSSHRYFVKDVVPIEVAPLHEILSKRVDEEALQLLTQSDGRMRFDFLNVDCEGLDLEVLQSNDWNKFRPRIVLVEILKSQFQDISRSKIAEFLEGVGFSIFAKQVNTVLFADNTER